MFKLKDYLWKKEDKKKGFIEWFRYVCLGFRPVGNIIMCLIIILVVAIPCVIILSINSEDSIASSVLTGVVASGVVALVIEIGNNIRRSRQRLLVLHEYLMAVAEYEQFLEWSADSLFSDLDYEEDYNPFSEKLTKRLYALANIELEIIPPIDSALDKGREFLSVKEIELLTQIEESSNDIAKIISSIIFDNMNKDYNIYNVLKEPFKTEIKKFSDMVGIKIIDDDLKSVVFDFFMENFDRMEPTSKSLVKSDLQIMDKSIIELRKIIWWEPVYSEELIPFETRLKKYGIDISERKKKICDEVEDRLNRTESATIEYIDTEKNLYIFKINAEKTGVLFISENGSIKVGDTIRGILDEKGATFIERNEDDVVDVTIVDLCENESDAYKWVNMTRNQS